MQNHPELTTIDVQDNYVKDATADHLANLLRRSTSLKALNLSDCNMTEEENAKIIDAMKDGKLRLEKIGYNYNSLSSEQAIQMFDLILENK